MTLQLWIPFLLRVSVLLSVFAIGLGSRPSDTAYLFHRPAQLMRSLFAMYIVMPVVMAAIVGAVLQREIGDDLLQGLGFPAESLDLVRSGRPRRIARQALLPGLQKLLGPAIIHRGSDPLPTAQLGDAFLATQALENNPDLVLGREVSTGGPTSIPDHVFSRLPTRHGLLLSSLLKRYDEPEILPSSIQILSQGC
jgi:hypothetical protein